MALSPTTEPGVFAIPELGRMIKLTEWEEMDVYDTLALPAATQLAGNTLTFFTGVENRRSVHEVDAGEVQSRAFNFDEAGQREADRTRAVRRARGEQADALALQARRMDFWADRLVRVQVKVRQ